MIQRPSCTTGMKARRLAVNFAKCRSCAQVLARSVARNAKNDPCWVMGSSPTKGLVPASEEVDFNQFRKRPDNVQMSGQFLRYPILRRSSTSASLHLSVWPSENPFRSNVPIAEQCTKSSE